MYQKSTFSKESCITSIVARADTLCTSPHSAHSFVSTRDAVFVFFPSSSRDRSQRSQREAAARKSKIKVSFCSLTGYGTAKIQPAALPLFSSAATLSFPSSPFYSSSRCVNSGTASTSRQLSSQRTCTCSFSLSLVFFLFPCQRSLSRTIGSFLRRAIVRTAAVSRNAQVYV